MPTPYFGAASNLILLNGFIPTAKANLGIKAVNTVTLLAPTSTAGSSGFTVAREVMSVGALLGNYPTQQVYSAATMPDVSNDACLWWATLTGTSTTGTLQKSILRTRFGAPCY